MFNYKFNLNNWSGILQEETVFLLGNGPSLLEEDLSLLNGMFVIGMNRCYKIFDPTILMWQDAGMYRESGISELRKTKAIKVCRESVDYHKEFNNFLIDKGNFSFNVKPSRLRGFGCTGALAAQIAVSMGAGRIVLLGCDGKYGKNTDFYGDNPDHKEHTLINFKRAYNFIKKKCPVEVISCCSNDLWKRTDLDKIINSISSPRKTRIQWISRLL